MKIYTDGATSGNGFPGAKGGWAFIILDDEDNIIKEGKGFVPNATNNICELTALIEGCSEIDCNEPVTVYSDSAYCINCYKQRWYRNWKRNGWVNAKKQPVANKFLWETLIPFFENEQFTFEKVTGHADKLDQHSYWNNYVDRLAVEAKSLI